MADLLGNEFCLVSELTPEEASRVEDAGEIRDKTDHDWRVAAGRAG
jgi:hypothetical protein